MPGVAQVTGRGTAQAEKVWAVRGAAAARFADRLAHTNCSTLLNVSIAIAKGYIK